MDSNSGIYTLNAWQDNAYTIMFTQGESNVKIVKFRLVDNSGNINLTNLSEDNVFFAIKRPDGKEDLLSCIIDDPINGIISCRITSYTTAISGNVKGEIRIVYNDGVIKFYGVNLKIHEGVSDSAAEQSSPFSALTEALQKVLVMTPEGTVEIDDEITENGENPVSSGTIYGYVNSAIEDYADTVDQELDEKADLTNKVFKMEHLGVLFPSIQNGLPNVDTTNNTLTIRRDTSLLLCSTNGSTQTRALAPSGDVVVDYSSIASSAIKIYYNLANDSFNALAYNGVPSQNDILICSIRDTSSFGTSNHGMSISCPYTVDGKLFGVNITEYIANNSITESKLATAYKQSVQDSINGLAASFQNVVNGLSTNINAVKKLSLTNLNKGVTFTAGSVTNDTGAEAAANNRICSGFISVSDVRFLDCSVTTGYKYAVTCYDSQKTFIAGTLGDLYWRWHSSYHTEECIIPLHPAIKYIRITVSDTSNSTSITLDDSSKVKALADYSQYRQFQFLNNYCGKLQESEILHENWVNGTTSGNTFIYDSARIFSGLIECPKSGTIKIRTATGYQFWCSVFDENWTRVSTSTNWETNSNVEIGNNYKWFVVTVKTTDDSDILPSAASNCTISYIPTDNVQFVENVATSAATNAVTNAENIQRVENIVSNPCVDIGWEHGTLWENVESDSNTRIRSDFILVGKGTKVKCNPNYKYLVFKYDRRKKWISNDTTYSSDEKVIDEECFIRIVMAKADYSTIGENEINTIANTEIIIRQFPQSIIENVSDFSDSIPSYYQPQLKTAINSAIGNTVSAGINGESFIFFSDPHWEGNAKWSPALIKEVVRRTSIDTIICCGDLIEGGNKAQMVKTMNDFITRFKGAGKLFVAYGNHDGNTIGSDSAEDYLSKGETYALAQKQSDYDICYGDLCYYYFDNPTTKTRFIVLDTGIDPDAALDSTQRTWFQTTLNNMPTGYHALIFAHIIYVSDNWRVGMSALEFNRTDFMDEICTICDTFNSANNGKKVEAMFGGHTHFDLDPTLDPNPDPESGNRFTSTGGIPIIIIDCDTVTTASADGQGNRNAVKGTITEQCIDFITVNYLAGEINCVRFGRGSDRIISY